MSTSPSPRGLAKGFTLIELLVVIAIIAILAAILFPVFQSVRENARRATCQSDLKQIGLAVTQYNQDYDEAFPEGVMPTANGWWEWSSARTIQPYIKAGQVYRCPDDAFGPIAPSVQASLPADRVPYSISYLPNAIGPKYHMMGVDNPQGLFSYGGYNGGNQAVVTLAAIKDPSDMIVVVEGKNEWEGKYFGCGQWLNSETDWCYNYNTPRWGLTEEWNIDAMIYNAPGDALYPALRKHNGGSNVLFSDGHVKFWRPANFLNSSGAVEPKNWIVNAADA